MTRQPHVCTLGVDIGTSSMSEIMLFGKVPLHVVVVDHFPPNGLSFCISLHHCGTLRADCLLSSLLEELEYISSPQAMADFPYFKPLEAWFCHTQKYVGFLLHLLSFSHMWLCGQCNRNEILYTSGVLISLKLIIVLGATEPCL